MRPAILIAILAVVALAAAVALRYGVNRLDGVVASTVERYGSALTGTAVDVDGVDLALAAGRAEIDGLTVDNPGGYETDYAVRVRRATVVLDVASLAGDVPVVEELVLDDALINAEQRDAASNLTDIQRHATRPSDQAPAGEPGRIIVERYRVRNARVVVTSEHLSEPEELRLEDVVVDDIGTAIGGATYSEAAEAMLTPIIAAARSATAARLRSAAADAVSDAAREELEEESDDLRERADEARREITETVEELLDRG
jgi:hypothetical protein